MATRKETHNSLRQSPRQLEVAVCALHLLNGAQKSIDHEDIAIKCHELAPELFAWRKYPEQVNLELVRVSLSDAKKEKNGALVSGSGRDGWRLTPAGVTWLAGRTHLLSPNGGRFGTHTARRTAGSIDTVRRDRESRRIEGSPAWSTWLTEKRIDVEETRKLFRIDSYTSPKLLGVKIARLLALFDGGSETRRFLEAAADRLTSEGNTDA